MRFGALAPQPAPPAAPVVCRNCVGDLPGAVGFGGAARRARKHDRAVHRFSADLRVRRVAAQNVVQRLDVGLDADFDVGDLAAIGVEEEDVGLPELAADHVGAARRAHGGVGDCRVGDQDVARIGRQIDDRRLAERQHERRRDCAPPPLVMRTVRRVRRLDLRDRVALAQTPRPLRGPWRAKREKTSRRSSAAPGDGAERVNAHPPDC